MSIEELDPKIQPIDPSGHKPCHCYGVGEAVENNYTMISSLGISTSIT